MVTSLKGGSSMSLSHARRSAAVLAAVGLALGLTLALVAPVDAAQPKTGKFRYYTQDPTNPAAVQDAVFFQVGDDRGHRLILGGAAWIDDACGRFVISSSLPVSAKGKAKFKGTASRTGGGTLKIKLKLKFTKKKLAIVSVKDLDPAQSCGVLRKVEATHYS
jgi:hypothetical protein